MSNCKLIAIVLVVLAVVAGADLGRLVLEPILHALEAPQKH